MFGAAVCVSIVGIVSLYVALTSERTKLLQTREWLQYCTNIKTRNGFDAILIYFIYLKPTFFTNIDVQSLRITHKTGRNMSEF
jgi:hypothetical protein